MMTRSRKILAFFCVALLLTLNALADACTVIGKVYDKASGNPLAGVEVLLIHEEKNIPSRTITDDKGEYVFTMVFPPGLYRIVASLKGYATTELRHISVHINSVTVPVPPISLEPASSAGSVSFEGRSAVVNASDAAPKLVIEPDAIQALPLSGVRTFDQLALLAPGIFEAPASAGTGPGVGPGVGTIGQFSVNGQRGRNNNFLVDMSDNNDQDVGVRRQGYVSLVPQSIESIENYQVISGNYQAEFGRNSGSIINAISKSGGNDVRGSVYSFSTGDITSARDFFDQLDGPVPGKSPYRRHQYGFVAGGPFTKNRTFWFGSFEQQQIRDRPEAHFAVPTSAQRSFFGRSPLRYSPGNATDERGMLLDDLSQYFLGEHVAFFGIAGRGVWSLVPPPNNPKGPYGQNTYTEQLFGDGRGTVFSFKVDHKFARHSFSARYNRTIDSSTIPVTGAAIHSSISASVATHNLSLLLNSNMSSRMANQARFSYGRTHLDFREAQGSPLLFGSQDQDALLNLIRPGAVFEQILQTPLSTDFGARTYGPFGSTGALGQLVIRPFSPIGVDVLNFPQRRVNNTFQYADTFIRHSGSHTLKAGIDIRRAQQNSRLDRNLRPLADFSGALGTSINLLGGAVRGTDLASIGYATGFQQVLLPDLNDDGRPDFDTTIGLRFIELGLFLQDDWRISGRANLNFGMRYELSTAPSEVNGKIEQTFRDLLSGVPAGTALPALAGYENDFDAVGQALGTIFEGRSSIYDRQAKNFAPRIGIAWDPGGAGKTAVRAGYGIFYDQTISAVTSQSRNVFPHLIPLNSSGFGASIQGLFLTNPQYLTFRDPAQELPVIKVGSLGTTGTPAGYFRGLIGMLTKRYGQGIAFTLPPRRLATPYGQHFHFTLEREAAPGLMLSAGYFGSRGIRLTRFRSPNGGISGIPRFDAIPSARFPGLFEFTGLTEPPARRDPRLGAYTVFENSGASSYHALQLFAQGRLSHDLQFTASYSWSHVLDDISDVFDGLACFARPQSDRALRTERASAGFDARHRLASSWIWRIPWKTSNGILGGWGIGALLFFRTGQPFTVNSAFDVNHDGVLTDRLHSDEGILKVSRGRSQYELPPGAVSEDQVLSFLAPSGSDGHVGRNSFRARGLASVDAVLFKKFRFDESRALEFRAECFNVANRTHFGLPVRILEAPSFGQAVDTAVKPRSIQLALKFHF